MWVQTRSGKAFDLANPTADQADVCDIAHALAHINRYTGHAAYPYSVAQHCVLMAESILWDTRDPALALGALLHDAHEAYIGDISSPMKRLLRSDAGSDRLLRKLEVEVNAAICDMLSVDRALLTAPEVQAADLAILRTEREVLLGPSPRDWGLPPGDPLDVLIQPMSPGYVKDLWLNMLSKLLKAVTFA